MMKVWIVGLLISGLLNIFSAQPVLNTTDQEEGFSADYKKSTWYLQKLLKNQVERLSRNVPLEIEGKKITSANVIPHFYQSRDYHLAWNFPEDLNQLIECIKTIDHDGLLPEDYYLEILLKRIAKRDQLSPVQKVELDLMLTDAAFLMALHLKKGKLQKKTLVPRTKYEEEFSKGTPNFLFEGLQNHQVKQALLSQRPKHSFYQKTVKGIEEYQRIQKNKKDWSAIPFRRELKKGDTTEIVQLVRERLTLLNFYLFEPEFQSFYFDESLERAVKKFQSNHGLQANGVIGKSTIEALNVTPKKRLQALKVNLERLRWLSEDLTPNMLLVNEAGFQLFLFLDGKRRLKSKIIIGRTYLRSPEVQSRLEYIEYYPYWHVPRSITKNEILPQVKKNPSYLSRHRMSLLDYNGNVVNPSKVDFNQYSGGNFPFIIRQRPGSSNALGLVKFIFPNSYNVYLHDTPNKRLFEKENRAFSHGCIRVEDALYMSEILLDKTNGKGLTIDDILEEGKTVRYYFEQDVAVLLVYFTAFSDEKGNLLFHPDVYKRDRAIRSALNRRMR
ncbi:L,D-transpeptidase family protein [Xanthovirga aplysinae]|uniref:L,D-transpeptidase family protein n=1 Tax=Xanthovirga aplysinae TaxID=2529853 RepID=UPI0012BC1428|nr:L,D-transpeptidase family protein [Xanthovirga aplysinae]MTI29817.1 hypothetical protein [Xanthovirga aplysinae]